ncbi:hybrid sensor histidine kinase/response regulator [Calothrix sp. 336/3]|uniref:hybrid sensor histidine kinase/response regulator n=1 Tax=Calothrix sp. 336/3 TaxID=1337936 RepID=UPI0004E320B6|nr:hybrid sensor histidine kinase/response regulator [Calothrix sp. 336/3]AKG22650.1 hypothetical protein IJ00_16440 [Calothrix sp. 336/3]
MITDESIREQGYAYFLAEAPELLNLIEQELFTLSDDFSITKVHNLMRGTHTIKGGAANVGLEVISKVAHYLENIVKSLYNPQVEIDKELQTLLIEAYECLRISLTAELTGSKIDAEEIIERATIAFAKLQEKLGDNFEQDTYIPSSTELGLDIVESIFETGVTERIDSLAQAIENQVSLEELRALLQEQGEVFSGLAESFNLPGFGKIAQTILQAISVHPDKVDTVAQIALADLQRAKSLVLDGDRTQGGEVSTALQELAFSPVNLPIDNFYTPISVEEEITEFSNFLQIDSQYQKNSPRAIANYIKVCRYLLSWFQIQKSLPKSSLRLEIFLKTDTIDNDSEYIEEWFREFCDYIQSPDDSLSVDLYRQVIILNVVLAVSKFYYYHELCDDNLVNFIQSWVKKISAKYRKLPPVSESEKKWLDKPQIQNLLFNQIDEKWTSLDSFSETHPLINNIWEQVNHIHENLENFPIVEDTTSQINTYIEIPEINNLENITHPEPAETVTNLSPEPINNKPRKTSFVRVEVEDLHNLDYLAGEILLHEQRSQSQEKNIQLVISNLTQDLQKHQNNLNNLSDLTYKYTYDSISSLKDDFDISLMSNLEDFKDNLQVINQEVARIREVANSLDSLLQNTVHIQEKKQRLVLNFIDNLVTTRMLPLATIVERFPQTLENLSKLYGKEVNLRLIGMQVLVDKVIAEKLYDPLLQLLRNAFDHGIEEAKIRQQYGKSEIGLIEIHAYNQGSHTVIEVRDDGQGLNLDRIRKKAVALGLISSTELDNETELFDIIFSPNFSTATKVSEISGRGMGLDIVRAQLHALDGKISVESLPHQGSKFTLKIPFSMTTEQLMIIQVNNIYYALLLDNIDKIIFPQAEQIREISGQKSLCLAIDGQHRLVTLYSFLDLIQYNSISAPIPSTLVNNQPRPVLILRHGGQMLAIEVDQIIGEQELVIRPLGRAIAPPKYIYGCTTFNNGNLILAIDSGVLVQSVKLDALKNIPTFKEVDIAVTPLLSPSKLERHQQASLPSPAPLQLEEKKVVNSSSPVPFQSEREKQVNLPSQKLILVVDDSASLRKTVSLTLEKSGYQVLQAENGLEALHTLQTNPGIEIVVSDLEMPEMNGFELINKMRKNLDLSKIPVVILTSCNTEKIRQLAQALGVTAYLTKPYVQQELLETVASLVS